MCRCVSAEGHTATDVGLCGGGMEAEQQVAAAGRPLLRSLGGCEAQRSCMNAIIWHYSQHAAALHAPGACR